MSFEVDAEGLLGLENGSWCFVEITPRATVVILNEENRDKAIRLLEKAEKSCLIARSLQCKIVLVPTVNFEEEPLEPMKAAATLEI